MLSSRYITRDLDGCQVAKNKEKGSNQRQGHCACPRLSFNYLTNALTKRVSCHVSKGYCRPYLIAILRHCQGTFPVASSDVTHSCFQVTSVCLQCLQIKKKMLKHCILCDIDKYLQISVGVYYLKRKGIMRTPRL